MPTNAEKNPRGWPLHTFRRTIMQGGVRWAGIECLWQESAAGDNVQVTGALVDEYIYDIGRTALAQCFPLGFLCMDGMADERAFPPRAAFAAAWRQGLVTLWRATEPPGGRCADREDWEVPTSTWAGLSEAAMREPCILEPIWARGES